MIKTFIDKTLVKSISLCSVKFQTTKTFVKMKNEEMKQSCEINKAEESCKIENSREEYKWKKCKKMACMLSFSGKDYMGMQNQRSQG